MAFTFPFCYTPRPEIVAAARRLIARMDGDPELRALFAEGKMLGVLEVGRPDGSTDFLYGFSGLAGGRNRVEGFVPPIYDLLDPEGHFKQEEARIVALTRQIAALKERLARLEDAGRQDPGLQQQIAELKHERRERSVALQEWIFDQFIVSNARGESLTIAEVFARQGLVPPGGTGECAAPKLLQFAYLNNLKPIAMGEFWYGASPIGEIRRHGSFYPSCTGKCGPLLRFMLEGLEVDPDPLTGFTGVSTRQDGVQNSPIRTPHVPDYSPGVQNGPIRTPIPVVYEDEALLVIDKPSGLLSVPGRQNPVSAQSILEKGHGPLYPCHRLDMDTSGLMVYAKTPEDQATVQAQFAGHKVRKTYRATLLAPQPAPIGQKSARNLSPGAHGWIDLPIAPDWYDRPRQKVDAQEGKHAVTEYEVLAAHPDGALEVRFIPHTGRTHQLRVHAAHPDGLGRPILGDRLYGGHTQSDTLQLRADTLSFRHPRTGAQLNLTL
jgi:tRNA pseudouridine32 synthase/23S rRNA pseudouridine746 synthase